MEPIASSFSPFTPSTDRHDIAPLWGFPTRKQQPFFLAISTFDDYSSIVRERGPPGEGNGFSRTGSQQVVSKAVAVF
jgi:hypothetical protein